MNSSIKRFVRYAALGFGGVAVGLLSLRRLLRVSADRRAIAAGEAGDGAVPGPESMKLLAVQVFFRHGARTPLKHIPGLEEVRLGSWPVKDICPLIFDKFSLSYT